MDLLDILEFISNYWFYYSIKFNLVTSKLAGNKIFIISSNQLKTSHWLKFNFMKNIKENSPHGNSIRFEFVHVHKTWISGRDKKYSNLIGVLGKNVDWQSNKGRARKNPVFGWTESSLLTRLISFPTSHASVAAPDCPQLLSQCQRQISLKAHEVVYI